MGMLMRRHFNGEQTALVNDVQEEVTETLEDKTVADLRIIAQQRGFTGISALTKAELCAPSGGQGKNLCHSCTLALWGYHLC